MARCALSVVRGFSPEGERAEIASPQPRTVLLTTSAHPLRSKGAGPRVREALQHRKPRPWLRNCGDLGRSQRACRAAVGTPAGCV